MSKHRHLPRRATWKVIDGDIYDRRLVRPVLIPGTRRAAVHPWRDRLHAARAGKPSTKDAA